MTTVIAYILVLTTWTNQGPRIVMQEFGNEQSCHAEMDRVNTQLRNHNDMTTTTRCSPKV